MLQPDDTTRCPCGSGDAFGSCCGPVLAGSAAPTAERLMRSRYTAFAVGDLEHLRRTWHPSTRPADLELEPGLEWTGLTILDRAGGGPFHTDGTVEFEARWRTDRERGRLHERSAFVREGGRWLYVDGSLA